MVFKVDGAENHAFNKMYVWIKLELVNIDFLGVIKAVKQKLSSDIVLFDR